MTLMDKIITDLFNSWVGPANGNIELAREQLHKNLTDQINGYWSGSTAYWIMTHGGFLLDAKIGEKKKLTALGVAFMNEMKERTCQKT